jgi:hypothetical protein
MEGEAKQPAFTRERHLGRRDVEERLCRDLIRRQIENDYTAGVFLGNEEMVRHARRRCRERGRIKTACNEIRLDGQDVSCDRSNRSSVRRPL